MIATPSDEFGDLEARWRGVASRPADEAVDRWIKVVSRELAAERRQESFRFWTAAAALLVLGWHLGFAAAVLPEARSVFFSSAPDSGSAPWRVREATLDELRIALGTGEPAFHWRLPM